MSLGFMIYLVGITDNIQAFTITMALISLCASIFVPMILDLTGFWDGYDWREKRRNGIKKILIIFGSMVISFSVVAVFIPSSSTLAAMYLMPRIVENKDMQQIPANAARLLNLGLEKFAGDLEKKAVGGDK